jgi:hypothetical protein
MSTAAITPMANEQPALPAAAAREEGEGGARVVARTMLKKLGDGSPVPILVVAQNHLLGDLIHADDDKRPQQPGPEYGPRPAEEVWVCCQRCLFAKVF